MVVLRPVIRSARPGDAPGIARVETETWRDAYPTLLPGSYLVDNPGSRSRWRKRLRGGGRNILIAEAAPRQIVAYAPWGPAGRPPPPPGGGGGGGGRPKPP